MKDQYRNQKWINFREEVIELDGGVCVQCGKSRASGSVLQVHHKRYRKEKEPWDYPFELCETLCKACHAAEHGIIRPEHGWDYVGEDDLGGLYGNCERCNTEIRYVFYIQHPHWEPMTVGTMCCDDLTGTEIATDARKYKDRLKRFLTSTRWKREGDDYVIRQKQIDIRIFKTINNYSIQMGTAKGSKEYVSVEQAKEKVFEFIESEEADAFFNKYSKNI